jgi:hypothetical protein
MKESTAQGLLSGILSGASPDEKASVQTQGQADHAHGSDNHVDGWGGTKNADGSVSVTKIHGR